MSTWSKVGRWRQDQICRLGESYGKRGEEKKGRHGKDV